MKKSILILTTLLDAERNVAEAGQILAGQLHKNLILLNCNDALASVVYYPGLPIIDESAAWRKERKTQIKLLTDHLGHQFGKSNPDQVKPHIISLIMEGNLDLNVKEILKKYPVEMIVMGARSGSSAEHFLFGSETKAITNHSTVPILIIPPTWTFSPLRLITFATKFLEQDTAALQYLFAMRKHLEARLEVVHIRKYNQPDVPNQSVMLKLIEKEAALNSSMIKYDEVFGKHLIPRLNRYCKENGSELLALSREHHSFLFRLLKQEIIDKYLSGHQIPLLIIPPLKTTTKVHVDPLKSLSGIVL